ncbi:D-alanyl-D-alanine carboxypeptidase family protein [Candidatus Saccharibacteria bacterium]|nr:D-alanyl-D-alanine carboxypeptidase family protein [Candidatus Saccharibacteria bacterium]
MIYEITAAGGNSTIIETDTIYENLAIRGNYLLNLSETAEQAGFINGRAFQMAGGEFCGNGSRAAAIIMSNFKTNKIRYSVSGFQNIVEATVEKLVDNIFNVSAEFKDLRYEIATKNDCRIVKLDGITHIIVKVKKIPKNTRVILSEKITKYNLENEPAVGLIYLTDNKITPLVYVKKVDTIYEETACGSGSVAVFLADGLTKVIQPTNKPIFVEKKNNAIILSSEMEILENKSEIYDKLFDDILTYDDVVKQPIVECGEKMEMIKVDFSGARSEFRPIARRTVVKMLNEAEKSLPKSLRLQVVNTYRPLSIQKSLFKQEMKKCENKIPNELERKRYVHKFAIAAPECAGHPTGGAVDIQIVKDGVPLDFGTKIWTFSNDTMTFSPFVNQTAQKNRNLLRKTMLSVGFAPFNGEWWHFSYGDQEWAAYYGKQNAIYKQL